MSMQVKEVAELVGISVRTLHYYDEIGLLSPKATTEAGYRLYNDHEIDMLQQILFYKELGFPLKEIKQFIHSDTFDRMEALKQHKKMLIKKRDQMNQLITNVEQSIKHVKGVSTMTNKEKFHGFDFSHNPYEQEARERWGDKAVDKSKAKVANMTDKDQEMVSNIFRNLADVRDEDPKSDIAQKAIKKWYDCLNKNFGTYSYDAFKGLGQMYIVDERFTKNIDQYGAGLAEFMAEAMAYFVECNRG